MRVKETISCFLCFVWLSSAGAVNMSRLFEFSVPVRDQSEEARKEAFSTAFYQVLIATTGDRNIGMKETVRPLLSSPDRYVKQFRYQASTNAQPVNPPNPNTPVVSPSQMLWVQFDQNAVSAALKNVGECIWASRQNILLWVAIENRGRRVVISSESGFDDKAKLEQISAKRGVPLLYPLFDMQDKATIRSSDIWGDFAGPILNASKRYKTDAVLVGRISTSFGNNWQGRWTLYENNNVDKWNSQGGSIEDAFSGGINGVADKVASRYKQRFCSGNVDHFLVMTVIGIRNMQFFAKAKSYLESLQTVASVDVEGISADSVQFKLSLRGSADDLNRTLQRDARMVPVPGTEQQESGVQYRFLP